mmetsp:Transcript_107403/g.278048  ORF Transcript_107403/g.278048 Transcript_107403/m.278048 type:complete len:257 (+) Transcript_107403:516-1286(+)
MHHAKAVVKNVGIESRALRVHGPEERRAPHRPRAARLGHLGGAGAAVGRGLGVLAVTSCRGAVVPRRAHQLRAGRVAPGDLLSVWVHSPQMTIVPWQALLRRARIQRQLRAVDLEVAPRPLGSGARAEDLELEGQRPAVDEVHVDEVAALHAHAVLAGLARVPERRGELGVDRRRALREIGVHKLCHLVDATLRWASAATEDAAVALVVAAHLRPIARGHEAGGRPELEGLPGRQPDVLPVRSDAEARSEGRRGTC